MTESLRPKVLSTDVADYVMAKWSGTNESGIDPYGDNILVLPDKASETAGPTGKILVPQDVQDTMSIASESGVIIAVGLDAFKYSPSSGKPLNQMGVPQVGDRIIFERYAGRAFKGNDNNVYRLMTDRCVGGLESKPATEPQSKKD